MPSDDPTTGVLLFDVNETLLDMAPLKERVADLLQESIGGDLWFATTLQYSLAMTVGGQYADFSEIGVAALRMLARNSDLSITEDDARDSLSMMKTLAPHADVRPALERLRAGGFRTAALSNSSASGMQAQLRHAGLDDLFEAQLSVESVGKFKPHADVYRWAAAQVGTDASSCMLVAAHGWDVAGAKWAGLSAALVAREGSQRFPLAPPPDYDVADMIALADVLGA